MRMKKLAFVDPFVVSPAVHCFNDFVKLSDASVSYHMPSKFGTRGLEENREETQGYIVVGSASHVTEPLEWHGPLARFLVSELHYGKPVFGCCFGHQLMAFAFGSNVDFAFSNQEKQIGVRQITLNRDFWNFRKGETFTLPVTHRQVVKELGKGLISVGAGLPNDIIIHESLPLLTTQGHPEASAYFCTNDIGNISPQEEMMGRKDGALLIRRFLENFN